MTKNQDGETKLETVSRQILDNFRDEIGAIKLSQKIPDPSIFDVSRSSIERMMSHECYANSLEMHRYSVYLQDCENRIKAILKVVNSKINTIVSEFCTDDEIKYIRGEMQAYAVARFKPIVQDLLRVKRRLECKLEEISGLSSNIRQFSRIWSDLGRSKFNAT